MKTSITPDTDGILVSSYVNITQYTPKKFMSADECVCVWACVYIVSLVVCLFVFFYWFVIFLFILKLKITAVLFLRFNALVCGEDNVVVPDL